MQILYCHTSKPGTETDMQQKDSFNRFNTILEVLTPFLIYYVVCNVTFLVLIFLYDAAAEFLTAGFREYMAERAEEMTQLVNSAAMVIAVLPLMPMLKRELAVGAEYTGAIAINQEKTGNIGRILSVPLIAVLAASSSIGLNILLTLTGFVQTSAAYQEVAGHQYGIAFGLGMVLFGLIAPIAEEIVFRGLVFNRMRHYCPAAAAIVVSGTLFGVYHGNLVQGVYGTCMGILLAYTYERMHSFFVPCLFHATANLMVYTLAQNAALHAVLFTVPGCIVLLTISVICIFIIERLKKNSIIECVKLSNDLK